VIKVSITINLSPSEEARLSAAAKKAGIAPVQLAERLVREHIPSAQTETIDPTSNKIHNWQTADNSTYQPAIQATELFAQWAKEDEAMTDEERADNDRIYSEIEKNGIPRMNF
jgi:hypothetical protein